MSEEKKEFVAKIATSRIISELSETSLGFIDWWKRLTDHRRETVRMIIVRQVKETLGDHLG